MVSRIEGTGVALVTPFTSAEEVDFPALENLVNHVIEGGVDNLVEWARCSETEFYKKDNAKGNPC